MQQEALQQWAIAMGAEHYGPAEAKFSPVDIGTGLNEGIQGLLEEGSPLSVRLAACLLRHPDVSLEQLLDDLSPAALVVLRHIAACGLRVEPEAAIWLEIKDCIGAETNDALPHWSRFCTQGSKGYAFMGQHFVWVKPRVRVSV